MPLVIRMNIQIRVPHTGRWHRQRAPISTHVVREREMDSGTLCHLDQNSHLATLMHKVTPHLLAVPGWSEHIHGTAELLKTLTMKTGTDYEPLVRLFESMQPFTEGHVILPIASFYPEKTRLHSLLQSAFAESAKAITDDHWVRL